jgi:hypothetical protein
LDSNTGFTEEVVVLKGLDGEILHPRRVGLGCLTFVLLVLPTVLHCALLSKITFNKYKVLPSSSSFKPRVRIWNFLVSLSCASFAVSQLQ